MIGRTNAGGGGAPNKSTIIVTAPTGSTVTCKSGSTTKTATEKNGTWTFSGLDNGTWIITATKDGKTATKSVTISRLTVEYVTITYFSATINITYPAGSTCTAENGSTTLTAPNTNGTWACVVPNAGDWTVSCTDGTKSASDTVTITASGESKSVVLAYRFYIFQTGVGTDSTFISKAYNRYSSNMTPERIICTAPSTDESNGSSGLSNSYDFTKYSVLAFDVITDNPQFRCGYLNNVVSRYSDAEYLIGSVSPTLDSRQIISIDISSVAGNKFIGMGILDRGEGSGTIYNIYLE